MFPPTPVQHPLGQQVWSGKLSLGEAPAPEGGPLAKISQADSPYPDPYWPIAPYEMEIRRHILLVVVVGLGYLDLEAATDP